MPSEAKVRTKPEIRGPSGPLVSAIVIASLLVDPFRLVRMQNTERSRMLHSTGVLNKYIVG